MSWAEVFVAIGAVTALVTVLVALTRALAA